jgi:hypothetical protein
MTSITPFEFLPQKFLHRNILLSKYLGKLRRREAHSVFKELAKPTSDSVGSPGPTAAIDDARELLLDRSIRGKQDCRHLWRGLEVRPFFETVTSKVNADFAFRRIQSKKPIGRSRAVAMIQLFRSLYPRILPGRYTAIAFSLWIVFSVETGMVSGAPTGAASQEPAASAKPTKTKPTANPNQAPPASAKSKAQKQKTTPSQAEAKPLASTIPVAVCHLDKWSCQEPPDAVNSTCLFPTAPGNQCSPPASFTTLCVPPLPTNTFNYDSTAVDATQIVKELGNPSPFILTAQGPHTVVISRSAPAKSQATQSKSIKDDGTTLSGIQTWLRLLISANVKASFQLEIPHASALGDSATAINTLQSPFFTAADVADRVQIAISGSPSCADLQAYLDAVRRIAWSKHPEPPVARVYSLDAPTASSLVNAATPAAKTSGVKGGGSPSNDKSAPAKKSDAASGNGASDDTSKDKNTNSSAGGKSASGRSKNSAKNAATSDDDSSPDQGSDANKGDGANSSDASTPPTQTPTTPASDLIVFAEGANPGDDSAITEQKRILALMDLPRPEMIVNGWVLQNSTKSSDRFGAANQVIRQTVNDHNAGLQQTILIGWNYLKQAMTDEKYFDSDFSEYLTGATVVNNADYSDTQESELQQRLSLVHKVTVTGVAGRKVCPIGQYCLGYTGLFQPLQPRLTNLLLAIIAAHDPVKAANCAINRVEGVDDASDDDCHPMSMLADPRHVWTSIIKANIPTSHSDTNVPGEIKLIEKIARSMRLVRDVNDQTLTLDSVAFCETADQIGILRQEAHNSEYRGVRTPQSLYLECFRRTATLLLRSVGRQGAQPSALGLTRSAIADFLFNYKMSQQYPHEFTAYDLTQSADAFNTALTPLIDAFNRDLTAYQNYLRTRLQVVLMEKHIASKDGFLNDGIVSVAVVSGHRASVDTTSVSYLDDGVAPELSTLANAVSGSLPGGGGGKSGKGNSGGDGGSDGGKAAAKAATAVGSGGISAEAQAALAGLATYQTSRIGISRELNLSVTPRSTVGASGAEMDVQLTSADSASPKYWSTANSSKNDPDLSRVGTHGVITHVRVDSVVLFDLSSFSAVLSKGRPLLPLLPPLVELPYIGTLAGVPLPAAKEYHSSSAIVSAVVVPTATDLAFGIRFVNDVVLDSKSADCFWNVARDQRGHTQPYGQHYCQARAAQSLLDLAKQPIREFNRRKIQCLATEGLSSVPDYDSGAALCDGLQFADVQHSAQ